MDRIDILGREGVIHVGFDLIDHIAQDCTASVRGSKYVCVTDENIAALGYHTRLADAFRKQGVSLAIKCIPPGESAKTRSTKEAIEDWMLSQACGRDTVVVALGGGVVGDLVGFAAATYMRGVPVVQVPTSLLAMVDSSIGGKTGLDTEHGKNLVGAFHQPRRVYINLSFLESLPARHVSNGLAEVIKTAAIWDVDAFDWLERDAELVLRGHDNREAMRRCVLSSVRVKADVVTRDEREGGLRELLNFGHTIGHAVEALSQPHMLHGEAVAIGMVKEAELARAGGHLSQANVSRLVACIRAYRLPTAVPSELTVAALMAKMAVDKKNSNGQKRIVLLDAIGHTLEQRASLAHDPLIRRVLSNRVCVEPALTTTSDPVLLAVPGSKSISNRVLLLAALGQGECQLMGLLHSDDTKVMCDALVALGVAPVQWCDGGRVSVVRGSGGALCLPASPDPVEVYLQNAGTASRFLCSCVQLVRASPGRTVVLTGNARMKQRPIGPLVDALRQAGSQLAYVERDGSLPVRITTLKQGLPGGHIQLAADVSSQYVSSILMAAPYASAPVTLELTGGKVVSQPYIDMTVSVMRDFGLAVARTPDADTYTVAQGVYANPATYLVEGDASSATYPLAIGALLGRPVTVTNVGSASVQGDAQFHRVLADMGCSVEQTATTTTVCGPGVGVRLRAVTVDMESMTDAFMTAVVLAAVAEGTSRITGIANQRVKECNRIAVMVEELAKLGVACSELDDGLTVTGRAPSELKGALIACHDDHRIAMSFAVLATLVPSLVIAERACVEKTYPEFWDMLEGSFGLTVASAEPEHDEVRCGDDDDDDDDSEGGSRPPSIVVVGMRGAGKSSCSAAAARALSWPLLDLDALIERRCDMDIPSFVAAHDWSAFRDVEAQVLRETLEMHPTGTVISCGGGIIEREENRRLLQTHPCTIEILRPIDDVVAYLERDQSRPALGEGIRELWARREPLYAACARYCFPLARAETDFDAVSASFVRLCRAITVCTAAPLYRPASEHPSYFLSLTFPTVREMLPLLDRIVAGVHALELRVDLLESHQAESVVDQLALLRRHSSLPIIFTVRTRVQGGAFDGSPDELFALLHLGVRCACEYIDVETVWDDGERARLATAAHSRRLQIISSYHVVAPETDWQDLARQFTHASHIRGDHKAVDVVKVVARAATFDDVFRLRECTAAAMRTCGLRADRVISLAMGERGQASRVLNTFLTPVTHPLLPVAAAPGQLSVVQIHQARALLGMLPARAFHLLGSPIRHSRSPAMHNAAFRLLGLPHTYSLCETDQASAALTALVATGRCGGASVTIPLKETLVAHMTTLSASARAIGAINTVVVSDSDDGAGRTLHGDNTDWRGIHDCVVRSVPVSSSLVGTTAIVVGAGGTARAACYALTMAGCARVLVWNRTRERSEQLARDFERVSVYTQGECDGAREHIAVVVATVPGTVAFRAPDHWLARSPVVVEMAYDPQRTVLVQQSESLGCVVLRGIDVLVEQALHQFSLWTGLEAPRSTMVEAAHES